MPRTEEVGKLLSAPSRTTWKVEGDRFDGVSFTLTSVFELGPVDRVFQGAVHRQGIDTAGRVVRRAKVWAGGGFVRTDTIPDGTRSGSARGLEHPKLGAVYLDVDDKTYLHFSPDQLSGSGLPESDRERPTGLERLRGRGLRDALGAGRSVAGSGGLRSAAGPPRRPSARCSAPACPASST